jgi:hypothetical protein
VIVRKDGHAESRDPASAGTREAVSREFSARSSSGRVRGENTSPGSRQPQADTGSFGSVNGLASESSHSAQDDRVKKMAGASESIHCAQDDRVKKMAGASESIHSAQDDRVKKMAGASESIHCAQDDRARGNTEKNSDLGVFRAFVAAGERLAEIHVHYEEQAEYPLTKTEKAGEKLDWRVTKMRLSKEKTSLVYNQFLTLSGIPPEAYEYRLGNRSALEWVIDQYQVSTDKRSGITNDPNRADDPQYIVRLIGQVITVSLETVKIVSGLPPLALPE